MVINFGEDKVINEHDIKDMWDKETQEAYLKWAKSTESLTILGLVNQLYLLLG